MKQLFILIFCTLTLPVLFFAFASPDVKKTDPGLLYSKQAMERLKKEIEAKNKNFDATISHKPYLPLPQGTAYYLAVEGAKVARIKKLIDEKANWREVVALLDAQEKADTVYFIKYKSDKQVRFYPVDFEGDRYTPITTENVADYTQDLTGSWVYSYGEKTNYSEESIVAMFVQSELKPQPLSLPATTCIRYTDHLVDTNTTIFTGRVTREITSNYANNPTIDKLITLAHDFPGEPEWKENKSDSYYKKYLQDYEKWQEARRRNVDEKLSKTTEFKTLLQKGYEEVRSSDSVHHFAMDEFESYVEKYISPSASLALKRKRLVVGGCSMDTGPIIHAINIARLAGETCCMEIFLRSHLNILNDRFSRVSDGSYAEPGRETYGRELEFLGTRLEWLIPGTLLTSRNLADNHYRGDVNRAGRAMAELEGRKMIYKNIEGLIRDNSLDLYNRLILVFLAESYNHSLFANKQTEEAKNNLKVLQDLVTSFPTYLGTPLKKSIASVDPKVKN